MALSNAVRLSRRAFLKAVGLTGLAVVGESLGGVIAGPNGARGQSVDGSEKGLGRRARCPSDGCAIRDAGRVRAVASSRTGSHPSPALRCT